MQRYTFLIILACTLYSVNAQQTILKTIVHDGMEREYVLYIPDSYTGNVTVPLVFNFHGFGGSAQSQMENGDFRPISDTAGFIIVHPQGTLFNGIPHWNVGGWTIGSTVDDVGFVDALIDSIYADYNIDLSKVYATGMSNGGFFSFLLACQLSNRIAAIASVTGSMTPETYSFCNPEHPMPIMQFHGTFDIIVPYNGADFSKPIEDVIDYWVEFNNCNTSPVITNLPDIDPNDGSTVILYQYNNGDNDVSTEHYKVLGGGHTWPGTANGGTGTNYDIDASVEIWNFFLRYQLDIGTGGKELADAINFNIYPNPANEYINIRKNGNKVNKYRIMTLFGKTLKEGMINDNSATIDIHSLLPGVYIISIGNATKSLIIR